MSRRNSKHSKPKEKGTNSFLITLYIFIAVVVICIVAILGVIMFTGNEKTLQAPQTPAPFSSNTQTPVTYITDKPKFNTATSCETREDHTSEDTTISYGAENVLDGKSSTTWTPKEDYNEPWICISSSAPTSVRGVEIENGYSKSKKLYEQNRRAKDIIIECGDKSFKCTLNDAGCGAVQKVNFAEAIETDEIKITIKSYYEGTTYNDLCITEIKPF